MTEPNPPDEQDTFLRWWTSRRDFAAGVGALAAALLLGVAVIVTSAWRYLGPVAAAVGVSVDTEDLDAPCNDQLGRPLKARDVVAAFRAEGFTMRSLPESFYCNTANFDRANSDRIIADVSNQRSVTMDEDVVDREGWATCDVSVGSPDFSTELFVDLNRGPDSPIFSGTKAVFSVANVDCKLYPHGDRSEEQIARAHAAMKRLARQLTR